MKGSSRIILNGLIFFSSVFGFENTSPFVLISSTKDLTPIKSELKTLSTKEAILSTIASLEFCPADAYILVNQPGLHSSDFEDNGKTVAPHLMKYLEDAAYFREATIYYDEDTEDHVQLLKEEILSKCEAKEIKVDTRTGEFAKYIDTTPRVIVLDFDQLPQSYEDRPQSIRTNDNTLYSVISSLPSPDYVVIYTASPVTYADYKDVPDGSKTLDVDESGDKTIGVNEPVEPTIASPKQSSAAIVQSSALPTSSSLFANYQFMSPGIWMSTIVALLLITIFGFAFSWISSLQVSYKSFDPQQPPKEK